MPPSRRRRGSAIPISMVAVAAALLMPIGAKSAHASTEVTGAGSTWVQIALDQWIADASKFGISVNYQGVGSSAGRTFYIINQVDFAASEIPFSAEEIAQLEGEGKSWQYLPDVAGGTSFMYNLHNDDGSRKTDLKLSAPTIAGIFTGSITDWSDPAITADNGGNQLTAQIIKPVIRSDGSGTSAQFSLYLASVTPDIWNPFAAQYGVTAPASYWPVFPGSIGQRGSDGVANYIANDSIGQGSIGYVEYGFATQRGFPAAMVHNTSGNYVLPLSDNVATALTHATLNEDLTQNLEQVYIAPETNAYPVSSYSYLITETTGFDPDKGDTLGQFILYAACEGQQKAGLLGYSPLPENLVLADFDAVLRIPGAPEPPALEDCDNPNIGGGEEGGGSGGEEGGGGEGESGGESGGSGSSGGEVTGGEVTGGETVSPGSLTPAGVSTSLGPDGSPVVIDPITGDVVTATYPPGVSAVPSADLDRYRADAARAIEATSSIPADPLVLAAGCVVLLVMGPVLTRRLVLRRWRRAGLGR